MLPLVSNSLSKKFPLALLLVFQIFLITEIERVTSSSPATISTDGVIEGRVGSHDGISLVNAHFRAGNVSRAVTDSCLIDYVNCDANDDKCCGHCTITHPYGLMCVEGGERCTMKDQTGCYTNFKPCCEDNNEAIECKDNYCRRKCTKAGSKLECQSDTECCGVGVGKINQCVPEDVTTGSKKICRACTSPDKTCNIDKDDCCNFDEDHQYSCTQSGDTWLCKKKGAECIANELTCQDSDKCCEDEDKGSECQQGKCKSCIKPGSGKICTKDTDCCTSTLAQNEGAYCKSYASTSAFCEICKKPGSVCDAQREKCCDENGHIGSCSRDLATNTYSCRLL